MAYAGSRAKHHLSPMLCPQLITRKLLQSGASAGDSSTRRELTGRERKLLTESQVCFRTAKWKLAEYSKMKFFR